MGLFLIELCLLIIFTGLQKFYTYLSERANFPHWAITAVAVNADCFFTQYNSALSFVSSFRDNSDVKQVLKQLTSTEKLHAFVHFIFHK
jgi:hypothetical protein